MSDTLLDQATVGPALISSVAAMSAEDRRAYLDGAFVRMKAAQGEIVAALGEVDRCQDYRADGATSVETWVVQRYGLSVASARGLVHPAKKAWDLPHLVGALSAGDLSLDKVRAVADVATPETDREWRDQAEQCSVAELAEVVRTRAAEAALNDAAPPSPSSSEAAHDGRYLRFNDECRTLVAKLDPDAYAEIKTTLEELAKEIPSEGETPWDQRLHDGFLARIRA